MALLKADVKPLSLKVRVNGSSKLILILNKPEIQLWWSFMLKKDPLSAAALKLIKRAKIVESTNAFFKQNLVKVFEIFIFLHFIKLLVIMM